MHDRPHRDRLVDRVDPDVLGGQLAHERQLSVDDLLADVPQVRTPCVDPTNEHVFHAYTLRVERRDELQARLQREGIGTAVYYPIPLHLQKCFSHLGYKLGQLPEAERAAGEVLSLPIYPELARPQLDYVIDAIRGFYR